MTDLLKATNSSKGKGFPVLSLPEAVKIVKDAGTYSRNLTVDALATYAGHTSSGSGPFKQKLAALKDWGFIVKTKDDNYSLTDRAMAIALPESSELAKAAMKEAFLGCELFARVYKESAMGIELNRTNMANAAVNNYKIAIQSKDRFIRSFVESAAAVGLADPIGQEKVILRPESSAVDDETISESDEQPSNLPPSTPKPVRNSVSAPTMQQTWEFEGGVVTLIIDSESALGLDVFKELPSVIESVEKLVTVLGPKKDSTDSVSD